MYNCALCTKTFKNSTNLHQHMFSHTKEKPHKCPKCPAAFGREDSLRKHVRCVHDGIKEIKNPNRNIHCPMCSFKCNGKSALKIHSRKHSAEKPFSCKVPNCGYKTKFERSLSRHAYQLHSDERPYECPSDGCSYKAKIRESLISHLRVHSNGKPFACQVPGCNYTCKTKGYLKGHAFRAHTNDKPLRCSACDFQAKTRSNLRQHQLRHTKVKRFQCQAPNCGFASHEKEKLKLHFDRKHRKKDVLCTESGCHFRCGSIKLLQVHLKRHVLPVWKCPGDSCSYSTTSKTSLALHIPRFHKDLQSAARLESKISDLELAGTADAMDTLCCSFPDCGFHTKFPHHYDRHSKSHKDEEKRNHVCSFCFSRFRHLTELQSHLQRHVGEKPYSCSHCTYTNVDCFELVKHARRVHEIYVIPRGKGDELMKCRTCGTSCLSYSEFVLHSMRHLQPIVLLDRLKLHIL